MAQTLGLAAEGLPIALGIGLIGVILLACGLVALGIVVLIAAMAAGAFFRDPERRAVGSFNTILSGADGRVTEITEASIPEHAGQRFHRVSVFMSPLDVHVNRAPASGEIVATVHTPGEFRAAFRDDAGERNERNLILINGADGRPYAMMQIAGYLARRIVCRLRPHDRVERGQRIGLIMFGSRVDHFMPFEYRVTVKPGERVRAGESVIGEL
ncbi:MAG: phosphatidylserine decarboxylase [Candidatus Binataceae bacterium]